MEKRIASEDGTELTLHCWKAESEQAMLLILHGLGEYGRKYIALARCLNEYGLSVVALDWRGFGKSGGLRGHVPSMDSLQQDLAAGIGAAREMADATNPLYLMGHSMGGNILLGAAHAGLVRAEGIIVSSPWIRKTGKSPNQAGTVAFLHRLFPTYRLNLDIRRMEKGRKPELEKRKKDPYNHKLTSLRLMHVLQTNARHLDLVCSGQGMPLLALHDRLDPLTDYRGTEDYVDRNGGELISYDTGEHTLHRGETKEEFCRQISRWILKRHQNDETTQKDNSMKDDASCVE